MMMMMINNNAYIAVLTIFPSDSRIAHISPEEDWNFPSKNCWTLGCFYTTKIRLGDISSRNKV